MQCLPPPRHLSHFEELPSIRRRADRTFRNSFESRSRLRMANSRYAACCTLSSASGLFSIAIPSRSARSRRQVFKVDGGPRQHTLPSAPPLGGCSLVAASGPSASRMFSPQDVKTSIFWFQYARLASGPVPAAAVPPWMSPRQLHRSCFHPRKSFLETLCLRSG
jgi:hypothetical protein